MVVLPTQKEVIRVRAMVERAIGGGEVIFWETLLAEARAQDGQRRCCFNDARATIGDGDVQHHIRH